MTREEIIKKYKPSSENLLTMLHDLQDSNEENYLTEEDMKDAAEYIGVPYTLVHGVATFYSMYSMKPRGKNIVRVCQSPPCHLMGSTDISKELMKLLGVKFGETTPCKTFTLEMSSCLGVCGVAPAIMINDRVYGNLDAGRLKEVIEQERRA
jgi:NADH:ubiquinone oxidoreductase subunit E